MEENNRRDRELLHKAKDGDLLSFERLVRLYEKKLLRVVDRLIFDRFASEEVVQDVFVSLYKSLDRIDDSKPFAPYLYTIAKNAGISKLRAKKRGTNVQFDDSLSSHVNLEKEYEDKEKRLLVHRAVDQLPEKYQKPIRLYYFHDVSYEKIAHLLKVPVNTVRTHLKRAKKLLEHTLTI